MSVIERADDVPVREKGGRGMSYDKLVEALRLIGKEQDCNECEAGRWHHDFECCLFENVAAAIEALQAEVKRLKEAIDELREAQTYIDHYGDKWMTSAKDVPTSAYNHGYMDGKSEAEAAQPHWVSVEHPPKGDGAFAACCVYDGKIYWFKAIYLDGKWLREMDGLELPVNYWLEIPQPPQEVQE